MLNRDVRKTCLKWLLSQVTPTTRRRGAETLGDHRAGLEQCARRPGVPQAPPPAPRSAAQVGDARLGRPEFGLGPCGAGPGVSPEPPPASHKLATPPRPRPPRRRPPPLTRRRCWCRRRRPRTRCCGGPRARRPAAPPATPCLRAQGTPAAAPRRPCARPAAWRLGPVPLRPAL